MSEEPKEYRVRVFDHGPGGAVTIRDLSEPVKPWQRKISVPAEVVPREDGLFQQNPVLGFIRHFLRRSSDQRRRAERLKGYAKRWEAIARQLAAFCAEMDGELARYRGYDPDDVNSADDWLEHAKSLAEAKQEPEA